jgi:hypothetical protein
MALLEVLPEEMTSLALRRCTIQLTHGSAVVGQFVARRLQKNNLGRMQGVEEMTIRCMLIEKDLGFVVRAGAK